MNSFISAIDNHNVAKGDESWFSKRVNATGELIIDTLDAVRYGAPSAVVAGVNSILNTGVAVANFVTGDNIKPFDTYEMLRDYDNDLGKYYQQHQEGAELAGFVATSFIPGMAGVKVAGMAKAGVMGTNLAKSGGLMRAVTQDYAKAARAEFATGSSPFSIFEGNTIKALTQGFGSNAIDAAAFEVFVTGTMYQSPILNQQSFGDLTSNMIVGTFLGGGIGGVLGGIGLVSGIKKARVAANQETFRYKNIEELGDLSSSDINVIKYYQQKFDLPEPTLANNIITDLEPEARLALISTERAKTIDRLDLLIQTELTKFSGGDSALAVSLKSTLDSAKTTQDVVNSMLHARSISRITEAEALVYGDVLFPTHGITQEALERIKAGGNVSDLFTPKATKATAGFQVKGDLNQLKVTGDRISEGEGVVYHSRYLAFEAGYDLYRNNNGTFSVNPNSKILAVAPYRRDNNNFIMDMQNNTIVDKATASLPDFASKSKPIQVKKDTVIVGDIAPIKVGDSFKYNPVEGNHLEAQARYIWAQEQKEINWLKQTIGEDDLPLLERAYYDGNKSKGYKIRLNDGTITSGVHGETLARFISNKKGEFAEQLNGKTLDEISARLNVSDRWLQGEEDHIAMFRPGVDYNQPRYARVAFDENVAAMETYNANMIEGMTEFHRQQTLLKQQREQTVSNYFKHDYGLLPDAPNLQDVGRTPRGYGAGSSLFGFSNANFGSIEGWSQFVGTITNRLKISAKSEMAEQLNPAMSTLVAAGPEALAEFSLITQKLRSSPASYVFHPTDNSKLILRSDYRNALENNPLSEAPIQINRPEVINAGLAHSARSTMRQDHVSNLKSNAGVNDDLREFPEMRIWYSPPIDTVRYKHFVLVEPKGINMGDKKRIIAAKDEGTLQKLIAQVDQKDFKVWTKQDSEDWHKAINDYDYALGMNESAVDSGMKRTGVLSDFFPTTENRRIVEDYMGWHTKQEEMLVTRMVSHKYSDLFHSMEELGKRYTSVATSQFRNLTEKLEQSVKDPYNDIVKTSLDISRASEYQWWRGFNDIVRDAIELPFNKLRETFQKTTKLDDKFVDEVNKISDGLGLGTPYKNAFEAMVANGNVAPKPWLAPAIAKAQAVLSTTLLQWDFLNAINNVVASPIILSAEMNYLRKAIETANPDIAGKLIAMRQVTLPDGSGIVIPTTAKLVKQAIENYRLDANAGGKLLSRYEDIGVDLTIAQQERNMVNQLTWKFDETPSQIEKSLEKAVEFGRKWTGNRLAESMTRFISADVMRQVTDLALEAGVLRNIGEANEYILNFVNKTQGNYLYSQRPIAFQGVTGQAISLFQTYQFNLLQQLFKYVGDGDKKSLGILLGLQGSIYGMQGLPAFNFLNTHIVGNASGNTQHRDLYYASNTMFGKSYGDWLLYGLGSNALSVVDPQLRVNLYTRGDINPRHATILPNSIEDIPIVSASVRFAKNLYGAADKIVTGGSFWPTVAQALEHNSVSRPLSGLAQVAQGYTTTSQSSLLSSSQDFWMIANLARVAGAKPFDEAVALDALYRINAYRAKDLAKIQELGAAIKTTVVGNKMPEEGQIVDFAKEYAKSGGRIESFNRFFANVYMNANQSQVNKMAQNLQSPFAKQMQILMGGKPIEDFMNAPANP